MQILALNILRVFFPPQHNHLHWSTSIFCTNFWSWAVDIFVTESYFTRKIRTNSNTDLLEGSSRTPILSGVPSANVKVESLRHIFSNVFSNLRNRIHISCCLLPCFYKYARFLLTWKCHCACSFSCSKQAEWNISRFWKRIYKLCYLNLSG